MPSDRRIGLAVGLLCLALGSCSTDRGEEGGTNGTEAGNALTGRLQLADGSPARNAQVVFRPSESIDTTPTAQWVFARTDTGGKFQVSLASGSWTLEANLDSLSLGADLRILHDTEISHQLSPGTILAGNAIGVDSGSFLHLPGLARWTRVGSRGAFRFGLVPEGLRRIQAPDGQNWLAPTSQADLLLVPGHSILSGTGINIPAREAVSRLTIQVEQLPLGAEFLSYAGADLPFYVSARTNNRYHLWFAPGPAVGFLAKGSSAPRRTPFQVDSTLVGLWLADADNSVNLAGSFPMVTSASTNFRRNADTAWWEASSKESLAYLSTSLSMTAPFSFLLEFQPIWTGNDTISLLWLQKPDATAAMDIGLQTSGLQLSRQGFTQRLDDDQGSAWEWLGCSWDGSSLRIYRKGKLILDTPLSDLARDSTRLLPVVGKSGRLRLRSLEFWRRPVNLAGATNFPEDDVLP